ncbi:flagellar biosynthesis repressor FlbT [Mesobacterium sp. TK19101]|uniref:Flagellar biosynthesis repressor FlbT n=1 Tax=Mesobacterium hydrothermale TaxID=3111907 RepID=A0ABU6HIG7_9RHOB|nr:flagellar biosynthesis repressor FlbT [Mesobacterium sp. TK19101]MEC3861625.1 flagellar biosynthesis repressor FlbT [Mesobacterium sp. TK19101]
MTGLVLKLAPKERVLINGAVIENGDRRSRICIMTPNANVLRLKDAIHPDDAVTPVRRLCYTVQLVLTGDRSSDQAKPGAILRMEELSRVFTDPDSRDLLRRASQALIEDNFYACLKSLRALLPREERLLAVAAR